MHLSPGTFTIKHTQTGYASNTLGFRVHFYACRGFNVDCIFFLFSKTSAFNLFCVSQKGTHKVSKRVSPPAIINPSALIQADVLLFPSIIPQDISWWSWGQCSPKQNNTSRQKESCWCHYKVDITNGKPKHIGHNGYLGVGWGVLIRLIALGGDMNSGLNLNESTQDLALNFSGKMETLLHLETV